MNMEENNKNRQGVLNNWNLGPMVVTEPKDYWVRMANIWQVPEVEARCMLCANCEYYDNTKAMQLEMLSIPLDSLDADGGGRGFCEKFDFICHNLRTCQAWEDKSVMDELAEEAMSLVLPQMIRDSYESN